MKARIAKKRLQALLGTTKPVASQAIQKWINSHFDNDNLIYNRAGVDQACRFRDMFSQCIATSYEQFKDCADVVGEHRSKSVVLPVVRMRANGLTVVMRDNFHDVVFSVVGLNKPLLREAQELLQAVCSAGFDSKVSFLQGFPDDMILSSYKDNYRSFSLETRRWTDAYAVLRLIGAVHNADMRRIGAGGC